MNILKAKAMFIGFVAFIMGVAHAIIYPTEAPFAITMMFLAQVFWCIADLHKD